MEIFTIESSTIKLVSLNSAFATLRNGRRVRSKEYKEFANKMAVLMRVKGAEFKAFESHYSPFKHEIHAKLELGIVGLYTKKGAISKTSGDLANYEKTLTDCVLVSSIDDSFITRWEMSKINSTVPFFKLTLKIVERGEI